MTPTKEACDVCGEKSTQKSLEQPRNITNYFCDKCYIKYLQGNCARLTGILEAFKEVIEIFINK